MLRGAFAEVEPETAVLGSVTVTDGVQASLVINRGGLMDQYACSDDGFERCSSHRSQDAWCHLAAIKHPTTKENYVLTLTNQLECTLIRVQNNSLEPVSHRSVPAPENAAVSPCLDHWVASEPHYAVSDDVDCCVVALSGFHSWLHIIRINLHLEPELQIFALNSKTALLLDPRIVNSGRDELALLRDVSHVLGLAFAPMASKAGNAEGNQLLVVLHQVKGPSHEAVNLECLAVDLSNSQLLPGPWSCRNAHPTSSLVYPFLGPTAGAPSSPSSISLPSGVLLASSRSLLLFAAPESHMLQFQGEGEPGSLPGRRNGVKLELARYALQGVPTCIEKLMDGCYVMGDSMAGLYLLRLQASGSWCSQLLTSVPMSVPSTLCFVQIRDSKQGQAGVLFVGSRCASSQAVSVPESHLQRSSQPVSLLKWRVIQPALVPSLAPVQDSLVIEDPLGGGSEQLVVVACGLAPSGRLVRARPGVTLSPAITGGPEVPASVKMFAIPRMWGDEHHAYLLFSFAASQRTEMLQLSGSHYTQVMIPGLDCERVSLLAAAVPGAWLLQVTCAGARVLRSSPHFTLHSTWDSSAPLSLAANHGSCVAVATGKAVQMLVVEPNTGSIMAGATLTLEEQVSALTVLPLGAPAQNGALSQSQELYVAVGLWVANSVTLHAIQGMQQCCQIPLQDQCPRSLAYMLNKGQQWLFVGTAVGVVLFWPIAAMAGEVFLGGGQTVQISSLEVQLLKVPGTHDQPGYLYAHSRSDAIFRVVDCPSSTSRTSADPPSASCFPPPSPSAGGSAFSPGGLSSSIQVARVHRGEHLRDVCPLHTAALPSGFAWVDGQNKLVIGSLDLDYRLQWDTAFIVDTPHHVGWHRAANCLVVLTENVEGHSFVRLVDPASLKQVLCFSLEHQHQYSALLVAPLRCSSSALPSIPSPAPNAINSQAPTTQSKEFIIIASYLTPQHPYTCLASGSERPKLEAQSSMKPESSDGLQPLPATMGMISIFEVSTTLVDQQGGESTVRYQLLCHASLALPSLCMCMTMAVPQWHTEISSLADSITNAYMYPSTNHSPLGQPFHHLSTPYQSSDHPTFPISQPLTPLPTPFHCTPPAPPATTPLLLLGCHNGIYMYDVFVDDNLSLANRTMEAALDAIGTAEDAEPPELDLKPEQWQQLMAESSQASKEARCDAPTYNVPSSSGAHGTATGDQSAGTSGTLEPGAGAEDDPLGPLQPLMQEGRPARYRRRILAGGSDGGQAARGVDPGGTEPGTRVVNPAGTGPGPRGVTLGVVNQGAVNQGGSSSKWRQRASGAAGVGDMEGVAWFLSGEGSGTVPTEVERSLKRDWSQRASLDLVGMFCAKHSGACITALQACGSSVWASKYLSSVTHFVLVATPKETVLLPLSMDRTPNFVQSMLALGSMEVVVASHTRSIELQQREPLNEALHLHMCAQRAEQEFEGGRGGSHERSTPGQHGFQGLSKQLELHLDKAAIMTPLATWKSTSNITLLLKANLGLHPQPLANTMPPLVQPSCTPSSQQASGLMLQRSASPGFPSPTSQLLPDAGTQIGIPSPIPRIMRTGSWGNGTLGNASLGTLGSGTLGSAGNGSACFAPGPQAGCTTAGTAAAGDGCAVLCFSSSGMVGLFVPLTGPLEDLRQLVAMMGKYPQYVIKLEEALLSVEREWGLTGSDIAAGKQDIGDAMPGVTLNGHHGSAGSITCRPSGGQLVGGQVHGKVAPSHVGHAPSGLVGLSTLSTSSWLMDCSCLSLRHWQAALAAMEGEEVTSRCRELHNQVRHTISWLLLTMY